LRGGAAATGDAELSALHVELGAGIATSSVKSDEFTTEELVWKISTVVLLLKNKDLT
jgi:hypothetical protein